MPQSDSQEITKLGSIRNDPGRYLGRFFSNLKMVGTIQILLTGILIGFFFAYASLTLFLVNTKPEGISMPNGDWMMYDPYTRAKDMLILIIPVFTTVVSFWLGLSIQEKRVTQAEAAAYDQRIERDTMKQKMDKLEGLTMMMPEMVEAKELRTQIDKIMQGK